MKNKLLSVLAHDLKEPLTSIHGFLELLADKSIRELEREELEKELLHRTKNATNLLNNILTWTRSQMDGLQTRRIKINLLELVKPVLLLMEPLAEDKAVIIVPLIPPDCTLAGDPDMLQLVLRNLLTNAIKYSHPGGNVTISAALQAPYWQISVKDEGDGILPDQQQYLFSLDTNPVRGTHKEKGAGLGLYLCRDFMERQGGTIQFQTVVGSGTTFSIRLPIWS
jgi:signal transduction histidine kinase